MQPPSVIFPDATAVVIAWLDQNVAQPVSHTAPKPRPSAFVTVARTGGVASGVLDNALITVEVWAASAAAAGSLAQTVRALVLAMSGRVVGTAAIGAVSEASGPQDLPDPDSKQARSTFTAQVPVRGSHFTPTSA